MTAATATVTGRCYCGAVHFEITATEPVLAGYCHCRDCRHAHAAPVYQYIYVRAHEFGIVSGEEHLRWYTRTEANRDHVKRYFCGECGSKVYNAFLAEEGDKSLDLRGTFPSLFDDPELAAGDVWGPRVHCFCPQSLMNLDQFQDGLPRYPELAPIPFD